MASDLPDLSSMTGEQIIAYLCTTQPDTRERRAATAAYEARVNPTGAPGFVVGVTLIGAPLEPLSP